MPNGNMDRSTYERLLDPLTEELTDLARWVAEAGQRVVVIFEGREAAGKSEAIDVITRTLNPRQCRVAALPLPTPRERQQWYFQRYLCHLPAAGEITLFDRSWYNRAGVETVMGFCSEADTEAFLTATPAFERHLVDDGILLFKYWLACDQAEQERRFEARRRDPRRRWKLNDVDAAARRLYDTYTDARERMLAATHTDHAPWTIIDFNDQALGKLTLVRDLLDRIPDTQLPDTIPTLPPLKHEPRRERYGVLQPIASHLADRAGR